MPRQAQPLAHRYVKQTGVLSYDEWATVIVTEAAKLGYKMTPRQVAEGLGVISAESAGDASEEGQGPTGHIGGLAESPAFGTVRQRLNPESAVRAALENWHANNKNWWPAWGDWETGESEGAGPTRWKTYISTAERALSGESSPLDHERRPPPKASSRPTEEGDEGQSAPAGDLMHVGLVAVLVLGGAGLVAFGGTRLLGASKEAKAAEG